MDLCPSGYPLLRMYFMSRLYLLKEVTVHVYIVKPLLRITKARSPPFIYPC